MLRLTPAQVDRLPKILAFQLSHLGSSFDQEEFFGMSGGAGDYYPSDNFWNDAVVDAECNALDVSAMAGAVGTRLASLRPTRVAKPIR